MASDMGIEILTEEQYCALQKLGKYDTKTSSWIKTPDTIRKLGGAIFVIFAMTLFSFIIMEQNRIMLLGDFVVR